MRLVGAADGEQRAAAKVAPRFVGNVRVTFPSPAATRPEPGDPAGCMHGHDFTVELLLECGTLVCLVGVVVYDDMRAEIQDRVAGRLAYRDLDGLFEGRPTCDAITEHLAT